MRIGPSPMIPAYPIQPDRQEVYPRALGQAYVGNPRLSLPVVKANIPEASAPKKTPETRTEATLARPAGATAEPRTGIGPDAKGPETSRPSLGSLLDVKG